MPPRCSVGPVWVGCCVAHNPALAVPSSPSVANGSEGDEMNIEPLPSISQPMLTSGKRSWILLTVLSVGLVLPLKMLERAPSDMHISEAKTFCDIPICFIREMIRSFIISCVYL